MVSTENYVLNEWFLNVGVWTAGSFRTKVSRQPEVAFKRQVDVSVTFIFFIYLFCNRDTQRTAALRRKERTRKENKHSFELTYFFSTVTQFMSCKFPNDIFFCIPQLITKKLTGFGGTFRFY